MGYTKTTSGNFSVTSRSGGSKVWTVNDQITNCDCPKFKFILRGQGECHHMAEVREGEDKKPKEALTIPKNAETFIIKEYNTPINMTEFIKKYGVEQMDVLMSQNIIVEVRGLLRIM